VSGRVRHPLKSLFLLLVLGAGAAYVWNHRDWFQNDPSQLLPEARKAEILERIRRTVLDDRCYVAMRGSLNWRPNEQRYRLDITVMENCELEARRLCEEIATIISELAQVPATVIAYDDTGREIARQVL
jgi:hypothetical protein